jgi:hypothetical protein
MALMVTSLKRRQWAADLKTVGDMAGDSLVDFVPPILVPSGSPAMLRLKTSTHTQQRLPVGTLAVIVILCPGSNIQ